MMTTSLLSKPKRQASRGLFCVALCSCVVILTINLLSTDGLVEAHRVPKVPKAATTPKPKASDSTTLAPKASASTTVAPKISAVTTLAPPPVGMDDKAAIKTTVKPTAKPTDKGDNKPKDGASDDEDDNIVTLFKGKGIPKRCLAGHPSQRLTVGVGRAKCPPTGPRYYYDVQMKQCVVDSDVDDECDNDDGSMFNTYVECSETCRENSKDSCSMPPDRGLEVSVPHLFEKFHWYHRNGDCYQFYYGGLGGNLNNFETYDACKKFCTGSSDGAGKGDPKKKKDLPGPTTKAPTTPMPPNDNSKNQKSTTNKPPLDPLQSSTKSPFTTKDPNSEDYIE